MTDPLIEKKQNFNKKLKHLEANKSFLGREYLNWLWFHIETHNHVLMIPEVGQINLFMDDRIVLVSASGSVREQCLKGTAPAYGHEAQAGLMAGKSLSECKFLLNIGSKSWSWILKADDLSMRSVKLPHNTEEVSDHLGSRIEALNILVEVNEYLFQSFMSKRLSDDTLSKELNLMKTWASERLQNSFEF